LGGKNHYATDRDAAEKIRAVFPDLADAAWANRGFHGRAAIWMAQQGIRQFVDVGCGLPTTTDTYMAVEKFAASARVSYVDHDPAVIAHAHALLARTGSTAVMLADVRDPASLLAGLHLDGLIDLAEPAGLLVTAVMHFVAAEDDPWGCVARLVAALAPGSFLALSHATADHLSPVAAQTVAEVFAGASERLYLRSRAEIGRFFDGLELVPPYTGAEAELTCAGLWGCEDPDLADSEGSRALYCAVGRRSKIPRGRAERPAPSTPGRAASRTTTTGTTNTPRQKTNTPRQKRIAHD
jgi:rhodanese-related sulfurtransferase